ncbi:unnamed protein product [Blepharisma stoltei]|uniref:PIH1 N-terminal domain-containing protein n=1 Tax=Blepharisma stoltei TaxID=1481888 RepID=A0AAU9IG86_9CILI|nr:unnamed protein product [Blepharisma stoltei]
MDINLSKDELDRLNNALKKPEFVTLLNEYVDEISDPKNRKEYEDYLKQLEGNGELPNGRVLIRPGPGFCIKTSLKSKGRTIKGFINICRANEIQAPSLERKEKGGTWSVPYAMGHPRHDKDKRGDVCLTLDCAYNPMAFELAKNSQQFLQLLCETAIKAAATVLKSQGETVSEDYKLLKKLKCKGGSPGSIMVNEMRMKNPNLPQEERPQTYKLSEEGPKLYKELVSTQMKAKEEEKKKETEKEKEKEKEEVEEPKIEEKRSTGIVKPKYKIVYTSPVDLGDFLDSRVKGIKRPKEAIVTIDVPFMEKISEAKIDVQDKLLIFGVNNLYYLEVKISYSVDENNANAKFDRTKKQMKITLPIIPGPELPEIVPNDIPEIVNDEEENNKPNEEIVQLQEPKNAENIVESQKSTNHKEELGGAENNFLKIVNDEGESKAEENTEKDEKIEIPEDLNLKWSEERQETDKNERKNLVEEIKSDELERVEKEVEENSDIKEEACEEPKVKEIIQTPCCIRLKSQLLYQLL